MAWTGGDYWTSVAAECRHWIANQNPPPDGHYKRDSVAAYEWWGKIRWDWTQGGRFPYSVWDSNSVHVSPGDPCVAANGSWKLFMCSCHDNDGADHDACCALSGPLTSQNVPDWEANKLTDKHSQHANADHTLAGLCFPNSSRMVAAYDDYDWDDYNYRLTGRIDASHGEQGWNDTLQVQAGRFTEPSLAESSGSTVYIAYKSGPVGEFGDIVFEKSANYGGGPWTGTPATLSANGEYPCIAAVGPFVFVCWHNASHKVLYRFSTNGGSSWTPPIGNDPHTLVGGGASHANVSALTCDGSPAVLVVGQATSTFSGEARVFYKFGVLGTGSIAWEPGIILPRTQHAEDDSLRPSVATDGTCGRLVYNAPIGGHKRGFHLRRGNAIVAGT
jgi:hypothetical protein